MKSQTCVPLPLMRHHISTAIVFLYNLFCAFLETKKMNNDERQVF